MHARQALQHVSKTQCRPASSVTRMGTVTCTWAQCGGERTVRAGGGLICTAVRCPRRWGGARAGFGGLVAFFDETLAGASFMLPAV
eukprot:m.1200803 g.1200803  ORF g.1200803 m.1200803 type:complete len:86 (-) comp24574_c0_seq35:122-379(-)